MSMLSNSERQKLFQALKETARLSADEINDLRLDINDSEVDETGHLRSILEITAMEIVRRNLKRNLASHSIEDKVNEYYELQSEKITLPSVLCDTIDGKNAAARDMRLRYHLNKMSPFKADFYNLGPEAVISLAVCEGPSLEDITVSAVASLQGPNIISALKLGEGPDAITQVLVNDVSIMPEEVKREMKFDQAQINIMGNTTLNLEGIGKIGQYLIELDRFREVRITSSGSSGFDLLKFILGENADAIIDIRALYRDSWAQLLKSDIAGMYLPTRGLGFYVSDIYGAVPGDEHKKDPNWPNKPISMVVARTDSLGRYLVGELRKAADDSVKEWTEQKKGRLRIQNRSDPKKDNTSMIGDYIIEKQFPSSPYKKVYLGCNKNDPSEKRIIKVLELPDAVRQKLPKGVSFQDSYIHELALSDLNKYNNPNIVKMDLMPYHDPAKDVICLIEEPFDRTLEDKYKGYGRAEVRDILEYALQIANGLKTCHNHSPSTIHMDLKLENIGIKEEEGREVLKLTDFGLSYLVNQPGNMATGVGSIHTRAPELFIEDAKATPSCDVWSFGAVLYRLAYGSYPSTPSIRRKDNTLDTSVDQFRFKRNQALIQEEDLSENIKWMPKDVIDLMAGCLRINPSERKYQDGSQLYDAVSQLKMLNDTYNDVVRCIRKKVSENPDDSFARLIYLRGLAFEDLSPGSSHIERIAAYVPSMTDIDGPGESNLTLDDYAGYFGISKDTIGKSGIIAHLAEFDKDFRMKITDSNSIALIEHHLLNEQQEKVSFRDDKAIKNQIRTSYESMSLEGKKYIHDTGIYKRCEGII